jgi:hypothetical protein
MAGSSRRDHLARRRRWVGLASGSAKSVSPAELDAIEDLQLIDVSLVAKTEQGLVEVPGLGLAFDRTGMTVRRRSGEEVSVLPWAILRHLGTELERDDRPGLTRRVELEVQSDRRRHEFLVYHVDPFALSGALSALSSRYLGSDLVTTEVTSGRRAKR